MSGGQSNGASSHALTVSHNFFGNTTGLATAANQVRVFQAGDWVDDYLRATQSNAEPLGQSFVVQSHSWISTYVDHPENDRDALRRLDYVIETGDTTIVVATNNNPTGDPLLAHLPLLAYSYNSIAVGLSNSLHSRGATMNSVYGDGRYKPDIVAPGTVSFGGPLVSWATPQVASAATILRQAAAGTPADHSETIKAILLAGATKQQFANFVANGTPNPWDRTPTRPLDDVFGAGQLNVYNSYQILAGGQYAGSTAQPSTAGQLNGWDYQNRKANPANVDIYYNFVVPVGKKEELSAILAWNVKVTDTNPSPGVFAPQESLQNLNLALFNSTSSFLGTLVDQSISTVDNVEHIYQTNLGPGTYTLRVTGAAGWDYALAWRFKDHSGDFNNDGIVSAADYVAWRKGFGSLYTIDDYNDWRANFGNTLPVGTGLVQVSAVPEPATLALFAACLLPVLARRRKYVPLPTC
jgi:hypothetical protein